MFNCSEILDLKKNVSKIRKIETSYAMIDFANLINMPYECVSTCELT